MVRSLKQAGVEYEWMISSFDHYNKIQRPQNEAGRNSEEAGLTLIPSPGYRNNISLRRLFDHIVFSVRLFKHLVRQNDTEIVVVSYPTVESAFIVTLVSKIRSFKVVVDIRDLWPDNLYDGKGWRVALLKVIASPWIFMRGYTLRNANQILVANKGYSQWAKSNGSKVEPFILKIPYLDRASATTGRSSESLLKRLAGSDRVTVAFGGALGVTIYDFSPFLHALHQGELDEYDFHIFGDGPKLSSLKAACNGFANVRFHGRVSPDELKSIYQCVDVLFAPYKNSVNFYDHFTNKFAEYACAGKPIFWRELGAPTDLLRDYRAGRGFSENDFSEQLRLLVKDIQIGAVSSENVRIMFEREFSYDVFSKRFLEFVLRVRNAD
jgi:glycosyltransferase involved in cell wall biosynthesis